MQKVLGTSPYDAKLGVHTWLNGAFWLQTDKELKKGVRLIVNAHDIGKKKVDRIEASVEAAFVYPLLRGRDVGRWVANPSMSILIPHDPERPGVGISEAIMRRQYPKTWDFFKQLKHALEERSGYKKYIKPAGGPFCAVYNIGTYTFQPYRVVWPEQSSTIEACVISNANDGRLVMPDHKLTIIGMATKEDAYFVCGVVNSLPV